MTKILGTTSAGAAGYVGLDWGNINAPTTTVNLSGTTVLVNGTSPLTESYASKGSAFTLAQALYTINQNVGEFSISGTTKTTLQRNQSSTSNTYTLNSSTAPTAITQAT